MKRELVGAFGELVEKLPRRHDPRPEIAAKLEEVAVTGGQEIRIGGDCALGHAVVCRVGYDREAAAGFTSV